MSSTQKSYEEKRDLYFGRPRSEIEPVLPKICERILEIGCGSGGTMAWLKQKRRVSRCVGIDLMPGPVEQAKHVFDVAFAANVETESLPEEMFDLILALDVLEHLVDPWTMVQRLHGRLAPGGAMVVSLPHIGHWSVSVPLVLKGQWDYAAEGLLDRTHLRFFSKGTAVSLMTSSGLVIEKIHREGRVPEWTQRLSPRWRWYARRIVDNIFPAHLMAYWYFIRVGHPAPGPQT